MQAGKEQEVMSRESDLDLKEQIIGIVDEVAQEVLSLLGLEGGKCVFLCSGSESVEYGVRVAQMLADRPLLMTMTDSYFGAYGSASQRDPDEWYSYDWLECAECEHTGEGEEGCLAGLQGNALADEGVADDG